MQPWAAAGRWPCASPFIGAGRSPSAAARRATPGRGRARRRGEAAQIEAVRGQITRGRWKIRRALDTVWAGAGESAEGATAYQPGPTGRETPPPTREGCKPDASTRHRNPAAGIPSLPRRQPGCAGPLALGVFSPTRPGPVGRADMPAGRWPYARRNLSGRRMGICRCGGPSSENTPAHNARPPCRMASPALDLRWHATLLPHMRLAAIRGRRHGFSRVFPRP